MYNKDKYAILQCPTCRKYDYYLFDGNDIFCSHCNQEFDMSTYRGYDK